jgi:hypothetical protein
VKKNHDHVYHYRGYWSDGGKCCIRIYREDRQSSVEFYSQLADNDNTSVTNMGEYLAAEVIRFEGCYLCTIMWKRLVNTKESIANALLFAMRRFLVWGALGDKGD